MNQRNFTLIMRAPMLAFTLMGLLSCAVLSFRSESAAASQSPKLRPGTLCATTERVIFSCPIRQPAKIVSLCATQNLSSETGYLQYRFGLPGKIDLEYPTERTGTQEKFHYTHYFRARVDLTEISFTNDGYEYEITDDYNGEEKPAQTIQGVVVRGNGGAKETRLSCRTKPTSEYSDLQSVLASGQ